MNVTDVQTKLNSAGFICKVDGALGPETYGAILGYAAGRPLNAPGAALGAAMARIWAGAGVMGDLGLIHWAAQACHETNGFRTLFEYGGPTYFAQYDGRTDLGNTEPGDGYRYRGRGIFQLTGRANYRQAGAELGEPLEDNPDLAAQPGIAVEIACWFWRKHNIQVLADADDTVGVTKKINGGLNGLADREAITNKLRSLIRPN